MIFVSACTRDDGDPLDRALEHAVDVAVATPTSGAGEAGLLARQDHDAWIVSDPDGASIRFPGKPSFRAFDVELPGVGPVTVHQADLVDDTLCFLFTTKQLPRARWHDVDLERAYDDDRDRLLRITRLVLVRDEPIRVDGRRARRITLRSPGDRAPMSMAVVEVAVPERRAVYEAVAGWAGPDEPDRVRRVLDSFAISASASGTR